MITSKIAKEDFDRDSNLQIRKYFPIRVRKMNALKGRLLTRRRFLLVATASAGAVAAAILGFELVRSGKTSPGVQAYPLGNRVVRIRALSNGSAWDPPNYTANDILNMIKDLSPTTLNRFVSGPQDPSRSVPGSSMNVAQFLQAALSNCKGPNSTTMFPRLSLKDYIPPNSPSLFFSEAQNLYSLFSSLSPPQTLISFDNTDAFFQAGFGVSDVANISNRISSMGWQGQAWGACAPTNLANSSATFAMICVNTTNWQPDLASISAIRSSQASVKEFEAQIDFPGPMTTFESLTPDQEASIIANLAAGQSSGGYHYMYPILQVGTQTWDSKSVLTSQNGPYGGISLYQHMKNLMNTYN